MSKIFRITKKEHRFYESDIAADSPEEAMFLYSKTGLRDLLKSAFVRVADDHGSVNIHIKELGSSMDKIGKIFSDAGFNDFPTTAKSEELPIVSIMEVTHEFDANGRQFKTTTIRREKPAKENQ